MKKIFVSLFIITFMVTPAMADKTQIGGTSYESTINAPIANGGDAYAGAIAGASANVKNTNIGINKQAQGQLQGQMQGQLQGQAQEMNNGQTIAPSQEITIVNPDNKRNLPNIVGYQAPGVGEYRGPYDKGIAGKVKPWERASLWNKESLNGMASTFGSAKCKEYPITKKAEATETLNVGKSKEHVVSYYECSAESDFELWGEVGTLALKAGAMFIEELAYAVTFANKSGGWNIGMGGGVSAVGNGNNDYLGGSVGGGTGFGSVTTEPIAKIRAIFVAR